MNARYARGLAAIAAQYSIATNDVPAFMEAKFGKAYAEESIWSAGGVWDDAALTLRERSLVVIAALIAQGGVETRLRGHVRAAVEHGATRAELESLVTLLRLYAGTPRASLAMEVVREELRQIEA